VGGSSFFQNFRVLTDVFEREVVLDGDGQDDVVVTEEGTVCGLDDDCGAEVIDALFRGR